MPRKLRLAYPGAVYHVINRGNYRRDIFEGDKTKAAFERCLFKACERSHWLLHAFATMTNHYHLALETPEGNLVAGMLPDTPDGWRLYDRRLELQIDKIARGGAHGWKAHSKALCRGWAIGSEQFKAALVKDYGLVGEVRAWEGLGAREIREIRRAAALARSLQVLGRQPEDAFHDRKRATWKLAIVSWMKAHTQAPNGWLSAKLHLGAPTVLSTNLAWYCREFQASDPAWKKLTSK